MTDNPIKSPDLCERCRYSPELCAPPLLCAHCPQHVTSALGTQRCICDWIKIGTPCPYFKEVKV